MIRIVFFFFSFLFLRFLDGRRARNTLGDARQFFKSPRQRPHRWRSNHAGDNRSCRTAPLPDPNAGLIERPRASQSRPTRKADGEHNVGGRRRPLAPCIAEKNADQQKALSQWSTVRANPTIRRPFVLFPPRIRSASAFRKFPSWACQTVEGRGPAGGLEWRI